MGPSSTNRVITRAATLPEAALKAAFNAPVIAHTARLLPLAIKISKVVIARLQLRKSALKVDGNPFCELVVIVYRKRRLTASKEIAGRHERPILEEACQNDLETEYNTSPTLWPCIVQHCTKWVTPTRSDISELPPSGE
jgi:hypothetical protein